MPYFGEIRRFATGAVEVVANGSSPQAQLQSVEKVWDGTAWKDPRTEAGQIALYEIHRSNQYAGS